MFSPLKSSVSLNSHVAINSEESPLLDEGSSDHETDAKVAPAALPDVYIYRRRWYILAIFSLLGFIQGGVWNTWGPISQSAFQVFPTWTNTTIAMLSNWGNITFLFFLFPLCWLIETCGLQFAVVTTGILQLAGTGMRCITTNLISATWLIHIGQFLNGIAGIVICSAPTMLSATWFPPNERITATAVSTSFNSLGIAVASILGPLIVSDSRKFSNDTANKTLPNDISRQKHEIMLLMYIEFIATAVVVFCIIIYFPVRPPRPPSFSAVVQRHTFRDALRQISRNADLWKVSFAFAISNGVYSSWFSVMDINLNALNVSQKEAGWLGFIAVTSACLASLLIARMMDYLGGKMKYTILFGLIMCCLCFMGLGLLCFHVIKYQPVLLYLFVILGGLFNNCLCPVFMELSVEIMYPVSEGVVGGFLMGLYNFVATIFLFIFFIPNIGTLWMNWCLIASTLAAIPVMFCVKVNYERSQLDQESMKHQAIRDPEI